MSVGSVVLGNAVWEILADTSGVSKDLAKSVDTINQYAARAGAVLAGVGAVVTGVTGMMVGAAIQSVESENLFEVSLGKYADKARQWSIELSDLVGVNEFNARRMIGVFDVMLKSMGISEEKALSMSQKLVELALDMSSFYERPIENIFEKLSAGITGEIEPLKRLGIVLNIATLEQEAFNLGIKESWQDMTLQQQTLVRYEGILNRTNTAQGDLLRTLLSPANQLRVIRERFAEMSITLGLHLLPSVHFLIIAVGSLVKSFEDWINGPGKETAGVLIWLTSMFGMLAAGVGAALLAFSAFGFFITGFGAALGAIGTALGAVGQILVAWVSSWQGVVAILGVVGSALALFGIQWGLSWDEMLDDVIEFGKGLGSWALEAAIILRMMWDQLISDSKDRGDGLLGFLRSLWAEIGNLFEFGFEALAIYGTWYWWRFKDMVSDLAASWFEYVENFAIASDKVGGIFGNLWMEISKTAGLIGEVWTVLANVTVGQFAYVVSSARSFIGFLGDQYGSQFVAIMEFVWSTSEKIVNQGIDIIFTMIRIFLNLLVGDWDTIWQEIADLTGESLGRMLDFWSEFTDVVLYLLAEWGADLWEMFRYVWDPIFNWIGDQWDALWIDIGKRLDSALDMIIDNLDSKFKRQLSDMFDDFSRFVDALTGGGFELGTYLFNLKGSRADGGEIYESGRYLIGERGPEILELPAGANVISNEEIHSSSSQSMNINVYTNDPGASVRAIKDAMRGGEISFS